MHMDNTMLLHNGYCRTHTCSARCIFSKPGTPSTTRFTSHSAHSTHYFYVDKTPLGADPRPNSAISMSMSLTLALIIIPQRLQGTSLQTSYSLISHARICAPRPPAQTFLFLLLLWISASCFSFSFCFCLPFSFLSSQRFRMTPGKQVCLSFASGTKMSHLT